MPLLVSNGLTNTNPTVAGATDKYMVAWKNATDQTICFAPFSFASTGGPVPSNQAGSQSNLTGVAGPSVQTFVTSAAPSLAYFAPSSELYMAWKGPVGDNSIYFSSASTSNNVWQPQTAIPNAETAIAPAIVATDTALLIVWKGLSDDNIWWALRTLLPADASSQSFQVIGSIKVGSTRFKTSATPALASDGTSIYMAWKGASTENLYSSKLTYSGQQVYPTAYQPNGGSEWGNYQWADQGLIPSWALPLPPNQFGVPTGAGPSTISPSLLCFEGNIFLAFIDAYSNLYICRGFGGSQIFSRGPAFLDTPPALTAYSSSNPADLVYISKGYGTDNQIYYNLVSL